MEDIIQTELMLAEAAESKKKSEADLAVPDPTPEAAKAAINKNTVADATAGENE